MVYTLRFFFSLKCSLFHNSNLFGSCIIHILYTECANIKKKFRRQKVNMVHFLCNYIFFSMVQQPPMRQGLLIFEVSRSHSDTLQSVEILLTSDQPNAATTTWQHTTLTTDRHPCPQWDSNPQSQQASGRRPTH